MKGRALLLVLSVLVAAVGTGLIYAYVRSANTRAVDNQKPVSVYVAGKDAPRGSTIDQLSVHAVAVPRSLLADDAVPATSDGEKILAQLKTAGSTTQIPVTKDLPLLRRYFTGASNSTPTDAAHPDYVKVTFPVEGAAAGVGLLQVGGPTIVFVTYKSAHPTTKVLLPRAIVESINGVGGDESNGQNTQPAGSQGTIALWVPIKDAQQAILASTYPERFGLWFGLPGTKTQASGGVTMNQLQGAGS